LGQQFKAFNALESILLLVKRELAPENFVANFFIKQDRSYRLLFLDYRVFIFCKQAKIYVSEFMKKFTLGTFRRSIFTTKNPLLCRIMIWHDIGQNCVPV